jgi:tRNA (mo5U34)-methyltransferase
MLCSLESIRDSCVNRFCPRLVKQDSAGTSSMDRQTSRELLRQQVEALPWFHQIDFGDGLLSPGHIKLSKIKRVADLIFTMPLEGKAVLEIGTWNGAYAVEATRRGAARVLATDHFIWHVDPRSRQAFDLVRDTLAPSIEVMDIDIDELSPKTVGTFDIVLFCGVLYHLRHPLAALERITKLVKEYLVLETHMIRWPIFRPYMRFYPGSELNNDPSNWWSPNRACAEAMLRDVGFRQIVFSRPDWHYRRGMFHAHW